MIVSEENTFLADTLPVQESRVKTTTSSWFGFLYIAKLSFFFTHCCYDSWSIIQLAISTVLSSNYKEVLHRWEP